MTVDATAVAPDGPVRAHYRHSRAHGEAVGELCRFQIGRVPCLVMATTSLAAGRDLGDVAGGWVLITAACTIGAVLNDRADVVSDRCNRRHDRPLAAGVLGENDARAVLAVAVAAVVAAELGLRQPTGALVGIVAVLVAWASACQPLALQRRGAIGLLALAAAYLVLPIVLVVGFGRFFELAPLALLGAGVLAHKDVRDEHGDRIAGKRTLLVRVGRRRMSLVAALMGAAGLTGLMWTIGPSWWIGPAAVTTAILGSLVGDRHSTERWTAAKVGLTITAALVGAEVAGG